MKIEKAIKSDSPDLTELTIRSKAHWDYSKEQINDWRDDLTVSESYITENEVYKMSNGNLLIGYYSFFNVNDAEVKLENLFIEPQFIGKGFGKLLMTDFLERAQKTKCDCITLDADPNVEQFYQHFGFRTIGQLETTIKNRFLPIMKLSLNLTQNNA